MLIDNHGNKQGIVPLEDALQKAQEADMDLVQVSNSDSAQVVAKILDYGKYIFDKKKNKPSSRIKVKRYRR